MHPETLTSSQEVLRLLVWGLCVGQHWLQPALLAGQDCRPGRLKAGGKVWHLLGLSSSVPWPAFLTPRTRWCPQEGDTAGPWEAYDRWCRLGTWHLCPFSEAKGWSLPSPALGRRGWPSSCALKDPVGTGVLHRSMWTGSGLFLEACPESPFPPPLQKKKITWSKPLFSLI